MKFFKLLFLLLIASNLLLAQDDAAPKTFRSKIINDTIKQVYGPKTTRYFYEDNVFFNDSTAPTLDTASRDFHLFNFVQKLNYEYQDLGNIGTAIAPIFYKMPEHIGVSSGWNGFNPYWDSEKVKYYDTKSTYSNMSMVLGGGGRGITDVDYTRNIKPNWNFGFNFRGLFIDKQILRQARGDRNVTSYYYDAFTTYHTKDSAYWLFANFQRMKHALLEQGGVDVEDDYQLEDFFDNGSSDTNIPQPNLTGRDNPRNTDLRTNIHLYHQYRIANGLELYHRFDKYRQYFEFDDTRRTDDFYDYLIIEQTKGALDRELFKTLRNELGIKGKVGGIFYSGYWAARNYSMDYKWIDERDFNLKTEGTEYYTGGNLRMNIGKEILLKGEADLLLSTNYKIKASVQSPWLQGSVARYLYKPSYIQQLYLGSHDVWVNDFTNVEATQLVALATFSKPWLTLSGGGTVTTLDNYIFFKEFPNRQNQKVMPMQSSSSHFIQSPEARIKLTLWKKLSLSGRAVYTNVSENSDSAFQIPEVFLHGQLAYKDSWFNDNFDFQVGVEAHWQSAYYANGYDVPTQQFYTQRSFMTNAFPQLDVFLNWKMKRGRMFFKYNNIVQAITGTGYLPTPYYPGQANSFDFGFDWMFFD